MPSPAYWDASSELISAEYVISEEYATPGRLVGLTHPSYPWTEPVLGGDLSLALQKIGAAYLVRVWDRLGLPGEINPGADLALPHVFGLKKNLGFGLEWLPIDADPRNSVLVSRYDIPDNPARVLEASVALMAVQIWTFLLEQTVIKISLRDRLGLRLLVHLEMRGKDRFARITGVMCSERLATTLARPMGVAFTDESLHGTFLVNILNAARSGTAQKLDVDPERVFNDGIRIDAPLPEQFQWAVFQAVTRDSAPAVLPAPAQRILAKDFVWGGEDWHPSNIERTDLIANSVLTAPLFSAPPAKRVNQLQDPASQGRKRVIEASRPNRPGHALGLGHALEEFTWPTKVDGLRSGKVPLSDSDKDELKKPWFAIYQSTLDDQYADEHKILELDVASVKAGQARSNGFAALSAYVQMRQMFRAVDATGLSRKEFFRFAKAPLVVRHRARIHAGGGRDGKTVNAQVELDPPPLDYSDKWDVDKRGELQVRFALADLKHSSSGREPLGLTTDPRWAWHEFCHVLLAGSTGNLELSFAHSAGDALAAIACDPASALVTDGSERAMRGMTFPWVYLNRRHDRPVRDGWSWNGLLHPRGALRNLACYCKRKGYDSEQILSTSLFRLYRCLGGDSVDPSGDAHKTLQMRQAAADYALYLIMRAVATHGSANAVPLESAQQFVALLSGADEVAMPATAGVLQGRVGGCAHKLIRWAFEAQGMFANVPVKQLHDAPGLPPHVDLYVDDGRPDAEGPSPRGAYMPVSLGWDLALNADAPAWHATASAMAVSRRKVSVTVENRGTGTATGVRVRLSVCEFPKGYPVPPWEGFGLHTRWTHSDLAGPPEIAGGASASYVLDPVVPKKKGRYLLLAHIDCKQDLANSNPDTELPCASQTVNIVDLVSGDNNLGLRVVLVK